ncbi:Zinc phosphodiesterase ELAC protein 2 [Boothiomyces sp. JEL0866]|nr:Zinc phosphodiesterase ELAC protein 2 [Boothiomyces sp. JEL0866]
MKYSLQIISTRNGSSRPSLYLSFDSAKYIFNAGEGTQRSCNEHQIKLSKLKAIFLSKIKWDSVGGLPGLIFTIADVNVPQVDIIGPKFLTHFLAGTRRFMLRSNFNVRLKEVENNNICYQDELITVYSTLILSDSKSNTNNTINYENAFKKKRKLIAQIFPSSKGFFLDDNNAGSKGTDLSLDAACCYVCKGPTVPGKMDAKKAKELGVKNGPDMGKLVRGESVISSFGKIVNPSDCVLPESPGSIFLILDCPDPSYIDSLVNNEYINKILSDMGNPPKCVIHQSVSGVFDDERYSSWIKRNNPALDHIFIADGLHNDEIPYRSSTSIINVLNQIDGEVFPKVFQHNNSSILKPLSNLKAQIIGRPKMNFNIEPKFSIETAKEKDLECASKGLIESINKIQAKVVLSKSRREVNGFDKYVIPLGTGSAIPGKYRNVSSTLFRNSETQTVLLDCGEGTLGQLNRHLGPKRLEKEVKDLKLVFISHMHADHHLGLFEILLYRKQITNEKLYIVGPYPMFDWIKDYSEIEDIGMESLIFIDSKEFLAGRNSLPLNFFYQDCSLTNFQTVLVKHCALSYAVSLQFQCGFKLAFSGDCRPSDKFCEIGQSSDLLIHEATLTDDLQEEALMKNHCTIGEAIQVGIKMKAKHVLLTHFSQRYPKFPESLSIPKDGPIFGVAFDLMFVSMKNFWKLPFYNKLYNQAFGELLDSDE